MPSKEQLILLVPAYLWDGYKRLPGDLALYEGSVRFFFRDFKKSHIRLIIPLTKIKKVEEFLLFNLERKGIKIQSNTDAEDLFILENAKAFRQAVEKRL